MKRAIVIGASSGMGRELVKLLSKNGYLLGLADLNIKELKKFKEELLPGKSIIKLIDVTKEKAPSELNRLIKSLGGADLIFISAGIGFFNPELDLEKVKKTIAVNVLGFSAMATTAFKYFSKRGEGHLAAITSIAALRGNKHSPEYGSSKAYISNYLEALRAKAFQSGSKITVTEVIPGYVRTSMVKREDGMFWISSVQKAAAQIYEALKKRKEIVYVTKRWIIAAWILKLAPTFIFKKYKY